MNTFGYRPVIYTGHREPDGTAVVRADAAHLSPLASLALRNHSPTGFEWGYGGSGPAQLALALLLHATHDTELALAHYQDYKWEVVANWSRAGWATGTTQILAWLERKGVLL